ncbi:HAD-IIA family hydrolase [Alicyclobacillus tolerans]|uniref:HAD-IIA family hydrolase n=1 Tax=Alicyclobacillus tolerans TaxID=90970 RepID=UPI001F000E92|nr:HAD-IIA family hydrolase [Alicyclobacillus tolerans]MCF8563449.1 HAD-IIA family hydrolase [Alicyclobacillus tolerans]
MEHTTRQWELALVDLDGTLYRGDEGIPGAAPFIARLRARGIQPVFFTNNSTRTPEEVCEKLKGFGIFAESSEVCTSAQSAAEAVARETGVGGSVAYIGADAVKIALNDAGFEAVRIERANSSDALGGHALPQVKAAVLGLDPKIDYEGLTRFCSMVTDLGRYFLTNGDVRLPHGKSFMPGNGALASFVTTATGIAPRLTGKPEPEFVEYALRRYGARSEKTLLIGDNLRTDVAAGVRAGIYTIQVNSGVQYARSDSTHEDKALGGRVPVEKRALVPQEVHDSVADLFPET